MCLAAVDFQVWPVLAYGEMVVLLVAGMIVISYVLGERHRAPGRDEPYESGIEPTGSARLRYGIRYYLIALFFLLFDVEAAIIFAWAAAARALGWQGYAMAVLFIVTLVVGLIYVWRLGGLDASTPGSDAEEAVTQRCEPVEAPLRGGRS